MRVLGSVREPMVKKSDHMTTLYLVGDVSMWKALAHIGVDVPVLAHLAAHLRHSGVVLHSIHVESAPLLQQALDGANTLRFQTEGAVYPGMLCQYVQVAGAIPTEALRGLADELGVVARLSAWTTDVEAVGAASAALSNDGTAIIMSILCPSTLVLEAINRWSQAWWLRIERATLR